MTEFVILLGQRSRMTADPSKRGQSVWLQDIFWQSRNYARGTYHKSLVLSACERYEQLQLLKVNALFFAIQIFTAKTQPFACPQILWNSIGSTRHCICSVTQCAKPEGCTTNSSSALAKDPRTVDAYIISNIDVKICLMPDKWKRDGVSQYSIEESQMRLRLAADVSRLHLHHRW